MTKPIYRSLDSCFYSLHCFSSKSKIFKEEPKYFKFFRRAYMAVIIFPYHPVPSSSKNPRSILALCRVLYEKAHTFDLRFFEKKTKMCTCTEKRGFH